jgi:PAS domain-containing protein
VDIRLNAFPSRDREFVDYVQAAWATLTAPKSPDALQQSLRVRYPAAIVTIQEELARHGDGPIVWYAFRTAAIGAPAIDDSPEDDAAWAILDDERRFLEVSPGLARIAELPARGMIGHAIEDFSNPADPTIREDIGRLWAEFRSGGTLASTLRFNFADGRPREVAYRLVADADGPGRHRLWVRVLAPSEGMPSR